MKDIKETDWRNTVMDDCIHLKACRRIQAIGKKHHLNVPRYCSEECTCYESNEDSLHDKIAKLAKIMRDGNSNADNFYGYSESYDTAQELMADAIKLVEEITGEEWEFTWVTI